MQTVDTTKPAKAHQAEVAKRTAARAATKPLSKKALFDAKIRQIEGMTVQASRRAGAKVATFSGKSLIALIDDQEAVEKKLGRLKDGHPSRCYLYFVSCKLADLIVAKPSPDVGSLAAKIGFLAKQFTPVKPAWNDDLIMNSSRRVRSGRGGPDARLLGGHGGAGEIKGAWLRGEAAFRGRWGGGMTGDLVRRQSELGPLPEGWSFCCPRHPDARPAQSMCEGRIPG